MEIRGQLIGAASLLPCEPSDGTRIVRLDDMHLYVMSCLPVHDCILFPIFLWNVELIGIESLHYAVPRAVPGRWEVLKCVNSESTLNNFFGDKFLNIYCVLNKYIHCKNCQCSLVTSVQIHCAGFQLCHDDINMCRISAETLVLTSFNSAVCPKIFSFFPLLPFFLALLQPCLQVMFIISFICFLWVDRSDFHCMSVK